MRRLPRLCNAPASLYNIQTHPCTASQKIVVNQPCADHDAWKAADYAPEQEFISKLSAIEGISSVETQEYTCQPL